MMTEVMSNVVFFGILGGLILVGVLAAKRAFTIARQDAEARAKPHG